MDIKTAYEHASKNEPNFAGLITSHLLSKFGLRGASGVVWSQQYTNGFHGCYLDHPDSPEWARVIARYERDQLVANAPFDTNLENVIPSEYHGYGDGKRAAHWNAWIKRHPRALKGSQDYGNCTTWAMREICACEWCADIEHRQEAHEDPPARIGTALTYGSRGSSGQGSTLSQIVKVVVEIGLQFEKPYCNGQYDCTNEADDERYGNIWGGRGVPQCMVDEVKADGGKIEQYAYATEEQAIKDVLALGHFLFHGSTKTASEGNCLISRLKSIGGHAQGLIGMDDTDEARQWAKDKCGVSLSDSQWIAINDQSWGPSWNSFPQNQWPGHLWGERPEGVWCITSTDLMRLVREWNDCIAISNMLGFPKRELPDWGWTWLG